MVLSCSTSDLAAKRISSCSSTALFPVVRWGLSPTQAYGPPCHHASAPAIPCLGRQWGLNSQQQAQHSLHRHYASQPNTPADSGDWETIKSVDENPASSSQAAEGKADSGTPIEHSILVLPLLIASAYSHVNRQYIKMRRRRKWWKKLGGYPRVGSAVSVHTQATTQTVSNAHAAAFGLLSVPQLISSSDSVV
eukprot:GHRR01016791.1.p1 GENE.GHRR01016791.1~~GHRR01016791.1.p1  ORF type:complete len:193 (+),score=40.67 GHRR01016791.1:188-766(+)